MAKIRCTNCGKLTRYQDGLCQSCRKIPEPEIENNDTAPADVNPKRRIIMKTNSIILGVLLVITLAALIIFFPVLPIVLGIWGIVALVAAFALVIGLTAALLFSLFPDLFILNWIRKAGITLGVSVLALALIIGFALPLTKGIVTPTTGTTTGTTEGTTTETTEGTTTETTVKANTIQVDGETIETFVSTPVSENGVYLLHDSDMVETSKEFNQAIGFVPDENLLVSDLTPAKIGQDSASVTQNWDTYLNSKNKPYAGFTDGTNDYNQYYNHQAFPQLPAYSWMVHTGYFIEMPGVGRLMGEKGRAVMVLLINRTDAVYRFRNEPVTVIAGFQGWGRIWNGDEKPVIETEKRITNHFLTRLGLGVPEKGFIGQTDQGAENATTVTVVTVEMIQWGNNDDGTPRYQFRLIRAETVAAIKK